jgi:hypothetical protein
VSDSNPYILNVGKEYNPHLTFIDSNKIFNPHSLDVVFTSMNYAVQSTPNQLEEVFSVTRDLLNPQGFLLSEISALTNPYNISSEFLSINSRVSYKGEKVILISQCLDYNPISGMYFMGHSLWKKDRSFIKAFEVPYYFNAIHQIKHLAERCGLTLSVYTYNLPHRLKVYPDRIEYKTATELKPKENLLLKFTVNYA